MYLSDTIHLIHNTTHLFEPLFLIDLLLALREPYTLEILNAMLCKRSPSRLLPLTCVVRVGWLVWLGHFFKVLIKYYMPRNLILITFCSKNFNYIYTESKLCWVNVGIMGIASWVVTSKYWPHSAATTLKLFPTPSKWNRRIKENVWSHQSVCPSGLLMHVK